MEVNNTPRNEGLAMRHFYMRSLSIARTWLTLPIILFAIFGLLDIYYLPHHLHEAWVVRLIVVLIGILLFAFSFLKKTSNSITLSLIMIVVVGVAGICVIIAISDRDELGYHQYHLAYPVAMAWTTMLGFRPLQLMATQVMILACYNATAIFFQHLLTESPYLLLGVNAFMFTFLLINFLSSRIIESFIAEDHQKKNLLFEERDKLSRAQKELLESNVFKAKLLSLISHDVRSPLASIKGNLLAHQGKIINTDELIGNLGKLSVSVDSLLELLNTLMRWAVNQSGKFPLQKQNMSLQRSVSESFSLVKPIADAKRISLKNNIDSSVSIFADPSMISSVLRNLISNALKFTERGAIIVYAEEKEELTSIFVEDTGMGIKAEVLEKLRNGQATTSLGTNRETGLGLGLIMCREFIEMHNGNMTFFSTENGTTFKFTIPREMSHAT